MSKVEGKVQGTNPETKPCQECGGSGTKDGQPCSVCKGSGSIVYWPDRR